MLSELENGVGIYAGYWARIGLLTPASNIMGEEDFHKMTPKGVSIQTARVGETAVRYGSRI